MRDFVYPEIELIKFGIEDVITVSIPSEGDDGMWANL